MTELRLPALPAWLRTISRKTLVTCIAGIVLSSAIIYAEPPVEVPKAKAFLLA